MYKTVVILPSMVNGGKYVSTVLYQDNCGKILNWFHVIQWGLPPGKCRTEVSDQNCVFQKEIPIIQKFRR